ncbi:MAG: hypothetical protein FWF00_03065 [Endomicrobia bacterium]|nr:hypothetical protein [Endomicrobiia bacterium]MCL2506656.1 hypothetical protein [Endomicrobiia bacterium]
MNKSHALRILLFFTGIILLGAVILSLSVSRAQGVAFSLVEPLFTATSAVCGAGLSVIEISEHYTIFGQIVLLALMQCGALGYMLLSVVIAVLVGKVVLKDRAIMNDMFVIYSFSDVFKILKKAIIIILSIELIGTVFLTLGFSSDYSFGKSLYLACFHSVSAFCNAGFSVFSDNLASFSSNALLLYTLMALMFLGGLGFFVLVDVLSALKNKNEKISYYSKIVISASAVLILAGFFVFNAAESFNLLNSKPFDFRVNNSLFQVISASTAGLNTLEIANITNFTAILLMVLMFIGAAPASAAGGIKITTLILVFAYLRAIIRNDEDYQFYNKTLSPETVKKAVAIFIVSVLSVLAIISVLMISEHGKNPIKIAFEAVSAFGINGLSMGITSGLSAAGKIIVTFAMFLGRIGTLTLLIIILHNKNSVKGIKYPEAKVLIG